MRLSSDDEKKIAELLKTNTWQEVTRLTGVSKFHVQRIRDQVTAAIPIGGSGSTDSLTPAERIERDRSLKNVRAELAGLKAKYNHLIEAHSLTEAQLEASVELKSKFRITAIKRASTKSTEAIPFIIASDWHCGAIVRPSTVNWKNEFNDAIFQERAETFFVNAVKLIKKEQANIKIRTGVLALLGDFIENSIHEELIEEQTLSPIQQMTMAQNSIASGIAYLLKETDLETIYLPTAPGNHGRLTEKMRPATNWKNSFEMLMYRELARQFEKEKRIRFVISDGYWNYLDVFDKTVGFHHGDAVKFNGGIGGLTIPLMKYLHRANQQRRIDYSFCGHFHWESMGDNYMTNNCLVGATAYGMRLGFPATKPTQIFRLLDADRGWTIYAPIEVERKSK